MFCRLRIAILIFVAVSTMPATAIAVDFRTGESSDAVPPSLTATAAVD
jgi:hypothetical protein